MADIAAPLTYGRVIWNLDAIGADTADNDQLPDVSTVSGSVTFSPIIPVLRGTVSTHLMRSEVYPITEGVLTGRDGSPGVSVLAYDTPGVSPSPVQWQVTVVINESNIAIPSFPLNVMAGDTVDLNSYIPVNLVPGIIAVVSDATRVAAEQAALRAEDAASGVDAIVQGLLQITDAPTQVGYVKASGVAVDSISFIPDDTAKPDHWMRIVLVMVGGTAGVTKTATFPDMWEVLKVVRTPQTVTYVARHKRGETDTGYTVSFNTVCNITGTMDWIRGAADEWDMGPELIRQLNSPTTNNAPVVVARKANNLITVVSVENTAANEAAPSSISGALTWYFAAQVGAATGTILVGSSFQNLGGPSPAVTVSYPNSGPGEGWAFQMAIPGTPGYMKDPFGLTGVYVEQPGVITPRLPAGTPVVTPGEISGTGGSLDPQVLADAIDAALTPSKIKTPTSALRRITQALAGQDVAPAKIVFLGAATTEGAGVTTWPRRFVSQFPDLVRKRASVGGFTPPMAATTITDFPVVASGGAVAATSNGAYSTGWAGRSAVLVSDTSKLAFSFTGTQLKIFYAQLAGGSSFTVKIDGAVVATVSTSNVTVSRWVQWSSLILTRGSHSVEIQRTGGGTGVAYIRGMQWHDNDENSGVWVYDGAHAGWKASDFLANEAEWGPALNLIAPDMLVVRLGQEDFAGGRTTIQAKSDLLAVIDLAQARQSIPASLVIMAPSQNGGSLDTTVWAAWQAMWKDIAALRNGVYIDESTVLPSPGLLNSAYNFDALTFNDKGHATLAVLLALFLPRSIVPTLAGSGGTLGLPIGIIDVTGLQGQLDALVAANAGKVGAKGGAFSIWKPAHTFPAAGQTDGDVFIYLGP